MLTTLLAKLPDCTSRQTIDTAAIDFAFINSKAARKRVVKFLAQPPKNRLDLLPYYARFVATLSKYMPDVGTELIAILDEEFRYLQKKKKVVVELAESRLRVRFRTVPELINSNRLRLTEHNLPGTLDEILASTAPCHPSHDESLSGWIFWNLYRCPHHPHRRMWAISFAG